MTDRDDFAVVRDGLHKLDERRLAALARIEQRIAELEEPRDESGYPGIQGLQAIGKRTLERRAEKAEAERDALREALEQIASFSERNGLDLWYQTPNGRIHESIARAALASEGEEA